MKKFWGVVIITCIGALIRIIACSWGLPYALHPDEMHKGSVIGAIILINNDSFSPTMFAHPGHFQITVHAILYYIYSFFIGLPAKQFVAENRDTCIYIARLFTAFCGTCLIPLAYIITEKIKKNSGIFAAFFCAFFPAFVQHSCYATPDIPLTLFFTIFILFSIKFLESHQTKYLVLMCAALGLGVTTKYNAALFAIPLAICIYIISNGAGKFFKLSCFSFFCSIFFVFIFSPTLFLEMPKVIYNLTIESRPTHLGNDGLGLGGNLLYYLNNFLEHVGVEFIILLLLGFLFCLKNKDIRLIPINFGWIFILCMAYLPLHWERWYLPGLVSPLFIASIGICFFWEKIQYNKNKIIFICLFFFLISISFLNIFISSCIIAQRSVAYQSVFAALDFCQKNNIVKENSDFEGYTPLAIGMPGYLKTKVENGKLIIPDNVKYIILSKRVFYRFDKNNTGHQVYIQKLDLVKKEMTRIAKFKDHNYKPTIWGSVKVYRMIRYIYKILRFKNLTFGDTILIYKRKLVS